MVGDGWKWQINKNTFRQRGGKIKLWRGEKLWVTRVHRKRHVRAERHHFLVGNELKADYHLGGPFFYLFIFYFQCPHDISVFVFFFFFFVFGCDETEKNTEWTAKSATPTGSVVDEVNVSGTETCGRFPPAERRRSTESIHTAVKHIVFHPPVYMRMDKHGERGCLQRHERRR